MQRDDLLAPDQEAIELSEEERHELAILAVAARTQELRSLPPSFLGRHPEIRSFIAAADQVIAALGWADEDSDSHGLWRVIHGTSSSVR